MNIFNRIIELIEFKGVSKNELSIQLGLSNSYWTKMAKSKGNVGSNVIEKIVRIYPDVSLDWLITGDGSMMKEIKTDLIQNDCDNCPYKELSDRYKSDIDRYLKEIDRLTRIIDQGTSESDYKGKALSA